MLRLSEDQLESILSRRGAPAAAVPESSYNLSQHITSALELAAVHRIESALITTLKLGLKALNKKDDSPKPYERMEQVIALVWLACHHPKPFSLTTATPMGGYRPDGAGGQMKGEGAKSGYPDLLMDFPLGGFHGLRIEMKRFCKSAKPSDEQLDWLTSLAGQGYRAVLCRGHQAAIHVMATYLGVPSPIGAEALPQWVIHYFETPTSQASL